jgi:excisionase family DNA binding protein
MEQELTPRQVAKAIGASEASLKRWCDKGIIRSVRTPGGHRRLLLSDVVRFLRESGRALPQPEVFGLPSGVGKGRFVIDRARREMADALAAGDDQRPRQIAVSLYLSGHSLLEICDAVVAPAFHALGERWQHGEIAVYQERRGCEITTRLLHELRRVLSAPPLEAPLAVGGTLSGDPYTLPNAMVELVLLEAGWRTVNCGCGLPPETMVAALAALRPRLAWLSISTQSAAEVALSAAEQIAEALRATGAHAAVGGRAAPTELETRLPRAFRAERLAELVNASRRLIGSREPEIAPSGS